MLAWAFCHWACPASAQSTPAPASAYTFDPVLREIYLRSQDREHRDREEIRRAYDDYLARNPDTPFAPQICVEIGAMYSYATARDTEKIDTAIMREYFTRAHELYGTQYSLEHKVAWSYLATSPHMPPEIKAEYYRWLAHSASSLTAEEISPVRRMGDFASRDVPLLLDKTTLEIYVRDAKRTPEELQQTVDAIIAGTQVADLGRLAMLASGTPLGAHAEAKMRRIAEAESRPIVEQIRLEKQIEEPVAPAAPDNEMSGFPSPPVPPAASAPAEATSSRLRSVIGPLLAALSVLGFGLIFLRGRIRRRMAAP